MEHHSSITPLSVMWILCLLLCGYPLHAGEQTRSVQAEDELRPGSFTTVHGQMIYVCYLGEITLMDSAIYVPSQGGCGKTRMKVLRYGYDAEGNPFILDTLRLNRPEDSFDSWLMSYPLRTDTSGVFSLKTFVRDEGCAQDWIPNEGELKYLVYPKFAGGAIQDNTDTLYIKNGKVTVNITALEPASGGDGVFSYKWKKFENDIPKATTENLVNHVVKADEFTWPKTVKFKRWAKDGSLCGKMQSAGVYKCAIFDELDPGTIDEKQGLEFCTLAKASQHTITATPATGGSKKYLYRWCIQDGTTLTPIPGATDCNLPLSQANLEEGKVYTFVRQVKDDTRFTEWTLSANKQVISMTAKPEIEILDSEACACNGEITLYFRLLKGDVDMYNIEFSPKLAAAIGKSGVIDYIGEPNTPNTIVIPDIPQLPDGDYSMNVRLGISCNAKSLEEVDCLSQSVEVKVVKGLDGYVSQKFDRMLVVDNQPDEAYPLSFTDFRWFKNGLSVGTNKQYYTESDGSKLNGSYFARLTGKDGKNYRSCSMHLINEDSESEASQASERTIYPTPARAGQPVMIHSGEAMMTIYSCTGERISTITTTNDQSIVTAPAESGMYYIQLLRADGTQVTEKLIVK